MFYNSNKISIGIKVLVENHVKNHSHKAYPLFLYSILFLILHRFMDKLFLRVRNWPLPRVLSE